MKILAVQIPDSLYDRIEASEEEASIIVQDALSTYFDCRLAFAHHSRWMDLMEFKVADIQNQIDQHRQSSGDDKSFDFEADTKQRLRNQKHLLDTPSYSDVNEGRVPQEVNPPLKSKIQEVEIDIQF